MKSILTILIFFGLAFSVFGQTRNVVVGTNGAIVQPTNFWSADASNARTGLGLGDSATNPASAFQSSSSVLSNLASSNAINLTNVRATNIIGTVSLATNVSGIVAIANGGTAATTAGASRTNLGLGATWLTNTNSTNFLSAIGISSMQALNIQSLLVGTYNFPSITNQPRTTYSSESIEIGTNSGNFQIDVTKSSSKRFYVDSDNDNQQGYVYISGIEGIGFEGTNSTNAILLTRTNLGLGWPALTNSNAGTSLVSVNTNGQVVSPTNFWQVAPIQTLVQNTAPNTNSTNAATNARNLYIYSLATNIINVTNTITLPTNTSSFDGDEVTVIHRGGSNSVTAVRQLGSTNNLISLNSYDESVKFIKDGNWDFYHNISFTEAIRFSGTNAAANVVTSRNTLQAASSTNYSAGVGEGAADRAQQLIGNDTGNTALIYDELGGDLWEIANPSDFRDAIGIPLAALTNTNNSTFQQAIFTTNTAPTNAGTFGDHVAWMGVSIVTNGVTNVFKIPLYK